MRLKSIYKPATWMLLTTVLLIGCATHQSKNQDSAGLAKSTDTTGPRNRLNDGIRGPVVFQNIDDSEIPERLLKQATDASYSAVLGRAHEQDVLNTFIDAGLVPLRAFTLPAILREIQQGNPVVIALGERESQTIEYVTAIGYELYDEYLYFKRGKKRHKIKFDVFARAWEEGNFWAYAFLPPVLINATRNLREVFERGLEMQARVPLKSRAVFERLITLDPSQADYYLALADNIYPWEKKRAIELTERAIQLEPNRFEAWYNLVALQYLSGQKKAARKTSRKIIEMFNNEMPKSRKQELRLLSKR